MDDHLLTNGSGPTHANGDPAQEQVRSQLRKICRSAGFATSRRLQEFLTYIVDEALAGRSDAILGKTIAMDVYGRTPDSVGDQENVVRVDAGRLRRKLNEYYAKTGEADPVRIHIDPGGYAPRFEFIDSVDDFVRTSESGPLSRPKSIWIVSALALAVLVPLLIWQRTGPGDEANPNPDARKQAVERQAIFEKSPASLQALNLSEQARDMIFPAADAQRVAAARKMFEQVKILDPDFHGGFAGLAQTIATQAALQPPGDERDAFLAEAARHAETAIRLSPANGWSQSAGAWTAFVSRDFETANVLSKRAVELAPDDLHVLEFDALIALFSGDFARVLASSDPVRHTDHISNRFVFFSAFASAKFHTGDYPESIKLFNENIAKGSLVSPITIAYLAAANQNDHRFEIAKKLVRQLEESWPDNRVDLLVVSLFKDPAHAEQIIGPLRLAGWPPERD